MSLLSIFEHTVVSRVSAHGRSTIPPYFTLPWALTMCQIVYKISGWSQCVIAIEMATRSQSPLASAPCAPYRILVEAVALSLNIEVSCTKFVTLLPRLTCLLRIESMHDRAIYYCRPRLCVATFSGTCLDASALWRAGVQKLPGRLPYVTVAWALTSEWMLSIRTAKQAPGCLPGSGTAQDTTVIDETMICINGCLTTKVSFMALYQSNSIL